MAAAVSSGSDDDRMIDGVYYPRPARDIDQLGFEKTKHALHFHGKDWDIPLTSKRDELTKAFIADAADAVGEPVANISDIRFAFYQDGCLYCKLRVRHRVATTVVEVQQMLAKGEWKRTKALYAPREKQRRGERDKLAMTRNSTDYLGATQRQQPVAGNLSFFGRANVGPEGPSFQDETDKDEEPVAYEVQERAKTMRTASKIVALRM